MNGQPVTIQPKPEYGKLYGITHDPVTKAPIIRVPRDLKTSIGLAKGPAVQPFIFKGTWHIRYGEWEPGNSGKSRFVMKTVFQGGKQDKYGVLQPNTKEAAEAWHKAHKGDAAVSNRPQKIPYFTFTRRFVAEDQNGKLVETFEPDFDAIEAHGETPRRVPIILTSNDPLMREYQWWTASELKCHGDGLLAERVITQGSANDPGWAVAKAAGEKMFLYSPCYVGGCPYAKNECKPHSTLSFQLANSLRLGSTAYFSSTGQVSADRLNSSLHAIQEIIARGGYSIAGIEMDLVLDSFKANHDGKPSLQPCVSLQVRAKSQEALKRLLAETSWSPQKIEAATRQLIAADVTDDDDFEIAADTQLPADELASLADPMADPEFDDPEPVAQSPAATATQQKQDDISRKLQTRRKAVTAPAPAPATTVSESLKVIDGLIAEAERPERPRPTWQTQEGMEAWFRAARQRVGDEEFIALVKQHAVTEESRWDNPNVALLFADVSALADADAEGELF